MKVVVVGTFSSGKTTTCNQLKEAMPGVWVVGDHCRIMLDVVPEIDWSTPEVRDYLIINQVLTEKLAANRARRIVVDGGIVNNVAHDRALLPNPPSRKDLLTDLGHDPYDIIFRCSAEEVPIIDDGQRDTNPSLRLLIDLALDELLLEYQPGSLVTLRGTPKERLSTVIHEIEARETMK